MPRIKTLVLAGLATFAGGLMITFPARVAYQWFAPQDFRLSGINGSVWRGNAAQGFAGGVYLTNVSWSFRPAALLSGKVGFATSSSPASGFLDADVAIGLDGSLTMSGVNGAIPISAFADLLPLKGIEGDVSLKFARLVLDKGIPVEATGTVDVANLVSRYLSPSPLGDYRAEFQNSGNGIVGSVEALSGVLELAGTIQFDERRNYRFTGHVAAKPAAPASIHEQLQYLGSPDARGLRQFQLEGRL